MAKMTIEEKKCITPSGRVSYPYVFKPYTNPKRPTQDPKFKITLLIPKTSNIAPLQKVVYNAAVEKWGTDKSKWPKGLKMPIKDGDEKADSPECQGHFIIAATAKQRPGIIDQGKKHIHETDGAFYAGCYARAELIAFAYDNESRGVSFAVQNIQKTGDGEPLSGRKNAEDVFDSVEDDSENPDNYDLGM